ncbi:MAG: IPT/TIG domain-containing protein, partial [Patescibacteria group bacterium]
PPPPPPVITSVGNNADWSVTISPGAISTVAGRNLSNTTVNIANRGLPLPTEVDGVSVRIDGMLCPLFYISPGQINFQVPTELGAPARVRVEVKNNGVSSVAFETNLVSVSPAAFTHRGFAILLNSLGQIVGNDEFASTPGQAVSMYLTGCGPTVPAVSTGQIGPMDPLALTLFPVRLAFNGQEAEVLYSGLTPGFIGVCQINFVLPGQSTGMNPERVLGEISFGDSPKSRIEIFSN